MSKTQRAGRLWWVAALVIGLALTALLVGCGGEHNGIEGIVLYYGDDPHGMELAVMATGDDPKYVVLRVTYPDGHQIVPVAAMLRDGYCEWFGTDLSPGTYRYEVYWVPATDARDTAILADDVISHGNFSDPPGEFTIQ